MTNIVFSPALQAPISLSPPSAVVSLPSDASIINAKVSPVPGVGQLSLVGAAVKMALAMSTTAGALSLSTAASTVVSGTVTPRSPTAGAVTTAGAAPTLSVASGAPVLTFPRIMLCGVGGDQGYGRTSGYPWTTAANGTAANTAIQTIGAYDIAVIAGAFEGWDSNGTYDRENLTLALGKSAATYAITKNNNRPTLTFYYEIMNVTVSGNPYAQWQALVNANNWFLYPQPAGGGTATRFINYSAAWPTSIGNAGIGASICGSNYGTTSSGSPTGPQGPARTFGNYASIKLLMKGYTGDPRFSFNAQMGSPSAAGIFLDECFVAIDGDSSTGSASLDGVTIAPGTQQGGGFPGLDTVQPVMARGNHNMFDQMQTMLSLVNPGKVYYNFANFGQYANKYQFGTATLTCGLENTLHGGLIENMIGSGLSALECFQQGNFSSPSTPYPSGAINALAIYYQGMDFCLAPKMVGVGVKLPSADGTITASWPVGAGTTLTTVTGGSALEYQLMRYGLAFSLMDDGYFAPGCTGYDWAKPRWYDEYGDDSLTQVNVKRGYLGTPLTARPTTPLWPQGPMGVWWRAFTGGAVIWNPRGNGAQTVTLPQSYQLLTGTQQPSVNNGSVLSSITIPDGDGRIFINPTGKLAAGHSVASKTPLDQIYPRPDTETNTWARHRWAYYDGTNPFQYSIPIGVRGGSPSYWFQLIAGPAGMSVGQLYGKPNYGIVTWTPTGTVTGATCTVRVFDQDGNHIDVTWTVSTTSSTTQFVFFATTGSDLNGTGTISNPYQTWAKCLGPSNGSSTFPNAIAVFRAGTYNCPTNGQININLTPMSFIAFPGETVTLNLRTGRTNPGLGTVSGCHDLTFQNINLDGGNLSSTNYRSIWLGGVSNRQTIQGMNITNPFNGTVGGDVTTSIFWDSPGTGVYRQYLYICDSTESGRNSTGGNAYTLFAAYVCQHMLVERCTTSSGATNDLYLKASCADCTIRYCHVTNDGTGGSGSGLSTGCQVDAGLQTQNIEICYNTVKMVGTGAITLNYGYFTPGVHWAYRNTVYGQIFVRNGNTAGPYILDNNVIQNPSPQVSNQGGGGAITNNGTECQAASGVIDTTTLLLTGTYRTNYLGTRGAEIA